MLKLTLDRYIFSQLCIPFSFAIGGLLFVLMTREMTRVTELLVAQGVSFSVVVKLILYILPSFMLLTLPIATLLASTCAFSRLTSDHELIAIQASGVGLPRLLIPVLLFSVSIYVIAFSLSLWAQPWSGISLKALALKVIKEQLTLPLNEGVFNSPIDGLMIYIPPTTTTLPGRQGILIADARTTPEPKVFVAQDWNFLNDPATGQIGLRLTDGSIQIPPSTPKEKQHVTFQTYDMQLKLDADASTSTSNIPSLESIYQTLEQSNWTDVAALKKLEEYHRTWAIPAACLIFGFIGVPLGIRAGTAGRIGGIGIGVAGILFYYLLNIFGDFLVSTRIVTPWIAAWLPNAIFVLLSIMLFRWIIFESPQAKAN